MSGPAVDVRRWLPPEVSAGRTPLGQLHVEIAARVGNLAEVRIPAVLVVQQLLSLPAAYYRTHLRGVPGNRAGTRRPVGVDDTRGIDAAHETAAKVGQIEARA